MTPERVAQLRADYDPDKTYCNRKAALAVTEALGALATERARAERAERFAALWKRAAKKRRAMEQTAAVVLSMSSEQFRSERARTEAAEGREARLRGSAEAIEAWAVHVISIVRDGRVPSADVAADGEAIIALLRAALAGTPEDLPATTPRESHPATIRVTEVRRGVPTIHPDEIDPRDGTPEVEQ